MSIPMNVVVSAVMLETSTCVPVMLSVPKGMEKVIEEAVKDCVKNNLKEGKMKCGQKTGNQLVDAVLEKVCSGEEKIETQITAPAKCGKQLT